MRITYDPEADAVYISFKDTPVTTTHPSAGIAFDYDAEGRLAGIEILDASRVVADPSALQEVTLHTPGRLKPGQRPT